MTGVIWIIQLVHYPSFRFVNPALWGDAHAHHINKITYIVAPAMIAELCARIYWLYLDINWISIFTTILLLFIWLSTFIIQVPTHNKLEEQWSMKLVNQLIRTNWIRTLLWTLNTGILLIGYTRDLS